MPMHDAAPARTAEFFASLPRDRTLIMGILNLTPDSFSDGGVHYGRGADRAVADALEMVRAGADLIDVGGESTRPGASPVDPEQERERILEVITCLAAESVTVSVDTRRASTAQAALEAGAVLVNDVSGMSLDEDMIRLIARTGAPYVLMHARGDSASMNSLARYQDVVGEVRAELLGLRERLLAGGVHPEQIILDPGLGFAKIGDQDWRLLAGLDRLTDLGHPVLVAGSRKRFLGTALAEASGAEVPADERDLATAVVSALAARAGAWAVRVHDVAVTREALAVERSWARAAEPRGAAPSAESGAAASGSGAVESQVRTPDPRRSQP